MARRASIRTFLFRGIEKWKMDEFVEFIPILLHLSLLFFFVGLCIFLSTISRAVSSVIIIIMSFCVSFYLFATLAPVLDPSAPYQTPISSILWRILQRLGGRYAHCRLRHSHPFHSASIMHNDVELASSTIDIGREEVAIYPVIQDNALRRDSTAMSWVYEKITDEEDLERFADTIPGILHSWENRGVWHDAFKVKLDYWIVESRLISLLNTTSKSNASSIDRSQQVKRATLSIDALFAIAKDAIRYWEPNTSMVYARPLPLVYNLGPLSRAIGDWEDDPKLSTKAFCASVMFAHRELLSASQRMRLPAPIDTLRLSKNADEALKAVSELRRILDQVVKKQKLCSQTDVATLLQVYFAVVQTKCQDIQEWMDAMGHALHCFHRAPLMSPYSSLPRRGIQLQYRNMPFLPPNLELFLYPHQVLRHFDWVKSSGPRFYESSDLLPSWFPTAYHGIAHQYMPVAQTKESTSQQAFRYPATSEANRAESLGSGSVLLPAPNPRDTLPILSLLDIMGPIQSADVLQIHWDSTGDCEHGLGIFYPDQHLLSIVPQGPFTTFASILQDLTAGGNATGLLTLIIALKSVKLPKNADISLIHQILGTLFPLRWKKFNIGPEGSQVLCVGALCEILKWERDASPETPCLFSSDDIHRILRSILHFDSQLSVEKAEQMLGDLLIPETTDIKDVSVIEEREQLRARMRTLYDRVQRQRSKWRGTEGTKD
ncbi:hypothetical protein C0991_010772 [Blastosporella zonata]|nr:hypothetical protein C0991_010772 [Blastosporella zonata]